MNNMEFIKGVYDEIQAPEELFGKVINMNKKESKRRNVIKFVTGIAATLAFAFVASNGICYATTGETWISKAIVYINGKPEEIEVQMHQEGDMSYGEYTMETDGNDVNSIVFVTVDGENITQEFSVQSIYLEEHDGRVYLKTDTITKDITEDFSDGKAEGTVVIDGEEYNYIVTGNTNEYSLNISNEK